MRLFRRASLCTLTRKSRGSRETEITALAVMPSVLSPHPVVTTVTPVGKGLIVSRRAGAPASRVSNRTSSDSLAFPQPATPLLSWQWSRADRTLLRAWFFHKALLHPKHLSPPTPDRLPVRAVPAAA